MNVKEEQIINAIKHSLSGLCLDIELNVNVDFCNQDIYGDLFAKYNFSLSEILQALNEYQAKSTDPYLFPFTFTFKSNYIVPINKLIVILEYCKKDFSAEAPPQNLFFGYSLLNELLFPTGETNYELQRQKALSLLTRDEVEKCSLLYNEYNELVFEIFKYRAKINVPESYEEAIKAAEAIFMS